MDRNVILQALLHFFAGREQREEIERACLWKRSMTFKEAELALLPASLAEALLSGEVPVTIAKYKLADVFEYEASCRLCGRVFRVSGSRPREVRTQFLALLWDWYEQ